MVIFNTGGLLQVFCCICLDTQEVENYIQLVLSLKAFFSVLHWHIGRSTTFLTVIRL
jgi:hypothetical protein